MFAWAGILRAPRRSFGVVAVAAVACFALVSSAVAKSPWRSPVVLGSGDNDGAFSSVMFPGGSTYTAWKTSSSPVRGRFRRSSGVLESIDRISSPGFTTEPRVAAGPGRSTAIAWEPFERTNDSFVRIRDGSGKLGPIHKVSAQIREGGIPFFGPADGLARVVWTQGASPGSEEGAFLGTVSPQGVGAVTRLDAQAEEAKVASDGSGNAIIAWANPATGVVARILTKAGTLGPSLSISGPAANAQLLQLSLSSAGIGHAIWSDGGIRARQIRLPGALGPAFSVPPPDTRVPLLPDLLATFADGRSIAIQPSGRLGPVRAYILSGTGASRPFLVAGLSRKIVQAGLPSVTTIGNRATVVWRYGRATKKTRRGQRTGATVASGIRSRVVTSTGRRGKITEVFKAQVGANVLLRTPIAANGTKLAVTWEARGIRLKPRARKMGFKVFLSVRR